MLLNLFIAAALAVSEPQDPSPTVLDDVVVEGVRRDRETSFAFVQAVSAPPFGSRTMAVWTRPICLSIDNLPPERAQDLAGRILGRAEYVGAEVGKAGCHPNVVVVFTADGTATATDLIQRNPSSFRPTSAATQLDRASLGRFASEDRAVRWWTSNMPVDVESGARVVALAGEHNPMVKNPHNIPHMRQTGGPPWRLIRGAQPFDNIQDVLLQTIVVVDVRLAGGVSYASLGDYLAMVILTQVDPQAQVEGPPTILGLFTGAPSVMELSQWDIDYLKALYETPVSWSNIRFQQQEVARRMAASPSRRAVTP